MERSSAAMEAPAASTVEASATSMAAPMLGHGKNGQSN
jgi:hypothetical protein